MLSCGMKDNIRARLDSRLRLLPDSGAELEAMADSLPSSEGWALRFLLACAPFGDIAEYPADIFLDYARHGVFLYETNPACRQLDESMFLHDVLFYRVNNEEITPCRRLFYDRLFSRVAGLSVKEAALEVNYWCCEEASYRSTDDRTASPTAVLASAGGRCGEESAFLTHALRSVGIPARQVYAPRWAHCDDNHAWVEAYCGGEWRFLGACEPEEAMNRGWFVNAASRAMLLNSRHFGCPPVSEDAFGQFGCTARLNQLERYARTKRLVVRVLDEQGQPVPGIPVDFLLINYAELFSIATVETDEDGEVVLHTGLGTLLLRAGDAEALAAPEETLCTLTIGIDAPPADGWRELTFLPPAELSGRETPLSVEAKLKWKKKLTAANERRKAKIAAFAADGELRKLTSEPNHTAKLRELLPQARGNLPEIAGFLTDTDTAKLFPVKEALLRVLPEKDLADCTADALQSALLATSQYRNDYPPEIFEPYLLNPRVNVERLTAYHSRLLALLGAESGRYRQEPPALWRELCRSIREYPRLEYPTLVTAPEACLAHKVGSELSRRVLFVAACRALGIPARLRADDGRPEYYRDGRFHPVEPEDESARLLIKAGNVSWCYRRNWSLARMDAATGGYMTLRLADSAWQNDEMTLDLLPGDYRLLTANRLPSGEVWALCLDLRLESGDEQTAGLALREAPAEAMLQAVPLAGLPLPGKLDGAGLRFWLATGEEPTEHILNELLENAASFNPMQKRMVFVTCREEEAEHPTLQRVLAAFPDAAIYADPGRELAGPLARRMYLDPDTAPFVLVTDQNGNGAYGTCGYNVGAADMLLKIARLVLEPR